jgi:hypothetical protein
MTHNSHLVRAASAGLNGHERDEKCGSGRWVLHATLVSRDGSLESMRKPHALASIVCRAGVVAGHEEYMKIPRLGVKTSPLSGWSYSHFPGARDLLRHPRDAVRDGHDPQRALANGCHHGGGTLPPRTPSRSSRSRASTAGQQDSHGGCNRRGVHLDPARVDDRSRDDRRHDPDGHRRCRRGGERRAPASKLPTTLIDVSHPQHSAGS